MKWKLEILIYFTWFFYHLSEELGPALDRVQKAGLGRVRKKNILHHMNNPIGRNYVPVQFTKTYVTK